MFTAHAAPWDAPRIGFDPRTTPRLRKMQTSMDKKAKKRLDVINKKLQTLRPRLTGAKQQADDLDEIKELENEIASLEAEAAKLKAS